MSTDGVGERSGWSAGRVRSLQVCMFLAALLTVVYWRSPALFSRGDQFAYDVANHYRPNPPEVGEVLIVEIDDLSLDDEHLGQFPWPRSVYAELIDRLSDARAIGIDVLLLEDDRSDGAGDLALAEAMTRSGNVVLTSAIVADRVYSSGNDERLDAFREKLTLSLDGAGPAEPERFRPPVVSLTSSSAAVGFANLVEDGDGRCRRFRPFYRGMDGLLYPGFACELARVADGSPAGDAYASEVGALHLADRRVPIQADHVWVNYAGSRGSIPSVSAAMVHRGEVDSSVISGRVVLIGSTASGLEDVHRAPYRGRYVPMYGVEMNANVVNSLLSAPVISYESAWTSLLSLPLLGLLGWWLAWRSTPGPGSVGLVLGSVALCVWYVVAFWQLGSVGPIVPRLIALAGVGSVAVADHLREQARLRDRLVDVFSAYVAPEVAGRLASNPDEASLGGSRQDVTVLFSDIRDFTALSERMDPQELVAQLTEYFNAMVDTVFRFGGLVDKFIGDGMMALHGCFDDDPAHPRRAVMAALVMREALPKLNSKWRAEGRPEFRIGVSIHTGPAVVGNMGADRKWSFTAAGDTVNVASRIGDLCKEYVDKWETVVLVSQDVADVVQDLVEVEPIGDIQLRGRRGSVSVCAITATKTRGDEGDQ